MSSEDGTGAAEGWDTPPNGAIYFSVNFQTPEMNSLVVPVEVRGGGLGGVRHTTAPGMLDVPPGKYYVSARLPAGQELFGEAEVPPGGNVMLTLGPRGEDTAQPAAEEVSYYLGLTRQTLIPRAQTTAAFRSSPLAVPVSAADELMLGAAESAAASSRGAGPSAPLEELGFESRGAVGSDEPSDDPIHALLAEYASLQAEEEDASPLETIGGLASLPFAVPPEVAVSPAGLPASYDASPVELSLRLFRGNILKAQAQPLPAAELSPESGGLKYLRLKPEGTDGFSLLQVARPGRPVLNVALPMSGLRGCEVVISRLPAPERAGTTGDDVSVDVHLGDLSADMLLRYRAQGMIAEATQLLRAKYEDPIGAAAGAYGLLQVNHLEPFGSWVRNLYAEFPWLPDGAAIEGELRARRGEHGAALDAFLTLTERGLPFFSEGLGYVVDRLDIYTRSADSGLDPQKVGRARMLLALLRIYSRHVDFRRLLLRFTGRLPSVPGAEPYEEPPPTAHADATVLRVTLAGGEGGGVTISLPGPVAPSPSESAAGRGAEAVPATASERQAKARMRTSPRASPSERKRVEGATLLNANDPSSIALRVQRILAQSNSADALDRLTSGSSPGDDEGKFLERIIVGEYGMRASFLELGSLASRTVARVSVQHDEAERILATGFLVSTRLLLTVHHAIPDAETARQSQVEFDYQHDALGVLKAPATFRLRPDEFFLTETALDFTLVAVEPLSTGGAIPLTQFGCNRLNGAPGKILIGEPVNIIHHPRGGPKEFLLQQNAISGRTEDYLHYRAATAHGSAGAPLYNNQWEVVALHHAKAPLTPDAGDTAAPGAQWLCEAVLIGSILRACTAVSLPEPQATLLDEMLNPPEVVVSSSEGRRAEAPPIPHEESAAHGIEPPPRAAGRQDGELPKLTHERSTVMPSKEESETGSTTPEASLNAASGEVVVTLPLRIGVSLGQPVPAPGPAPEAATRTATAESAFEDDLLEAVKPDKDYTNRPGYDPNFLGFPVPLPKLTPAIKPLAAELLGGGPKKYELKYHHYSVIMNRQRRLAFVSAVNMDEGAKHHFTREGGDRWFSDPRIDKEHQAGNEFYSNNPLDRGHLTRRADAAWGRTEQESKLANDDTFHFTNCSPQHEVFNQSKLASKRNLLLWGNIENHIARQGKVNDKRLTVFNGPVFRQNDRKHRGLQIPREYWKIVVFRRDDGRPAALAFMLSQASLIKTLPTEEFEVGPYESYQVRVSEIEAKTKLDFGGLRQHDPLEQADEGLFETADGILPLRDFRDMLF